MDNQVEGSKAGEGGSAVSGWAGIPAVTKYVIFGVAGLFIAFALVKLLG